MQRIARSCPKCKNYDKVEVSGSKAIQCPHCAQLWGTVDSIDKIFDQCPICRCKQFYRQKDFNQALGCLIMLTGIVLVPKTYGLSLPVFAFVDWLIYKKVSEIVICYKCSAEFRGFSIPKRLKSFMHHIGMKYDKFR